MARADALAPLIALLHQQRWAALATLDRHGLPEGAMVAFVMTSDCQQGYLHLSTLASHTRNLLKSPAAALVISEPDPGHGDPQQLARLALQIEARAIPPGHPAHAQAKAYYLAALPDAAGRFDFADFQLFAFHWTRARLVGGFGQACSFRPGDLTS